MKQEIKIGLSVLIALVVLYFGIEYLKGKNPFKSSNYYYALYEDVKGLTVSAPVTVNGIKVGQVDNVKLLYDRPDKVLVSFSLDKELRLPQGTSAVIESSLLGTASIVIKMNKSENYYTPGDTIQATTDAGMLGTVTDELLPGVGNVLPKVDSLLTNINNVVGNPSLNSAINNIDNATASLQQLMSRLNTATTGLPKIVSEVNSMTESLNVIAADLTRLSGTLADAPVDSVLNNLNRVSSDVAQLTSQLNNPDNSVGKLLSGTELYDNLTNVTSSLDSLFIDIKKNPKRYINIKLL